MNAHAPTYHPIPLLPSSNFFVLTQNSFYTCRYLSNNSLVFAISPSSTQNKLVISNNPTHNNYNDSSISINNNPIIQYNTSEKYSLTSKTKHNTSNNYYDPTGSNYNSSEPYYDSSGTNFNTSDTNLNLSGINADIKDSNDDISEIYNDTSGTLSNISGTNFYTSEIHLDTSDIHFDTSGMNVDMSGMSFSNLFFHNLLYSILLQNSIIMYHTHY